MIGVEYWKPKQGQGNHITKQAHWVAGYYDADILDSFSFYGKDIKQERFDYYMKEFTKEIKE